MNANNDPAPTVPGRLFDGFRPLYRPVRSLGLGVFGYECLLCGADLGLHCANVDHGRAFHPETVVAVDGREYLRA